MLRFLIIFLIFVMPAFAQDAAQEKMIDALNNLQEEVSVCWAYYGFVGHCVENDLNLSKRTQVTIDALLREAYVVGSKIGMTNDAILSRLTLFLNEDKSLMSNSCVNISSLLTRHADRCKIVVEHSDIILNEYLNK